MAADKFSKATNLYDAHGHFEYPYLILYTDRGEYRMLVETKDHTLMVQIYDLSGRHLREWPAGTDAHRAVDTFLDMGKDNPHACVLWKPSYVEILKKLDRMVELALQRHSILHQMQRIQIDGKTLVSPKVVALSQQADHLLVEEQILHNHIGLPPSVVKAHILYSIEMLKQSILR